MSAGLQPVVQGPHVELVIVGCIQKYLQSCIADLSQRQITTLHSNIDDQRVSRSKNTYIAGLHIPIWHNIGVTKSLRGVCLRTQDVLRLIVLKYVNTKKPHATSTSTITQSWPQLYKWKIGQRWLANLQLSNVLHTKSHINRILADVKRNHTAYNKVSRASHPRCGKNV